MEVDYSEIVKIAEKRYGLYSKRPVLYGKNGKVLAVIPSNPRKTELGDLSVLDWLDSRISSE